MSSPPNAPPMKAPPSSLFSPDTTLGEVLDILAREIEVARAAPRNRDNPLSDLLSMHAAARSLVFGAGQGPRL